MKFNKKLFKSGGSMAVVVPSELIRQFDSDEYRLEMGLNSDNQPAIIMTPVDEVNELDALEADPEFALFVNAIYQDAVKNPQKLLDDKDVWDAHIVELLKDVDPGDDE